jgi:hypothetical protein
LVEAYSTDRWLYNAIEAFIFFGTPHRGLIVDEIREMLANPNHPRLDLLGQIDSSNHFLDDELRRFKNVLKERKVVSFYERRQTRQLVRGQRTWLDVLLLKNDVAQWTRTGPYLELSSKEGSLLGLANDQEESIPVDEDHSRMVKFRSRDEPAYQSVLDQLQRIIPHAQGRVLHRHGKRVE